MTHFLDSRQWEAEADICKGEAGVGTGSTYESLEILTVVLESVGWTFGAAEFR